MIQDLYIGHRRKPHVFSPAMDGAVWATCLRSLAFGRHPMELGLSPTDEIYSHLNAYKFLLEIVCGLHSPILGETEVFGQFKNFAQEWAKQSPDRAPLIQRVLSDAKLLRSKYLSHLGTQSYGSWLKRNLKGGSVHILGGGQLVQEILPHIEKRAGKVFLHVRDPQRVTFRSHGVLKIAANSFGGGTLVIAAPMTNTEIRQWIGAQKTHQIFDLRDTSSSDPLSVEQNVEVHLLHDIFTEIQKTKVRLHPIVEQVKQEIVVLSEKLASHALVRPQGWDDLCA